MMFESTPQPPAAPISTSSEPNAPFKPKLTSKHERQGGDGGGSGGGEGSAVTRDMGFSVMPTSRTSAMRALQPRIIAHTVRTQILKYMLRLAR